MSPVKLEGRGVLVRNKFLSIRSGMFMKSLHLTRKNKEQVYLYLSLSLTGRSHSDRRLYCQTKTRLSLYDYWSNNEKNYVS